MTHLRTWLRFPDWFGDVQKPQDSFAVDHLTSLEWRPLELAAVVGTLTVVAVDHLTSLEQLPEHAAVVGTLAVAGAVVVADVAAAGSAVVFVVDAVVGTAVAVEARVVSFWPCDLESPTRLVSQPETF